MNRFMLSTLTCAYVFFVDMQAVVLAQAGSAEPSKPVVSERKAGAPLIDRRQLLTGAAVTAVTLTGCPCSICKPGAAQAAAWSYGE